MSIFEPIKILHVGLSFGTSEIKVGRLAAKNRKIWFEYDQGFLESGYRISPLKLPHEAGIRASEFQPFDGLFGVFNDSLPDGWGKLLLDRALTERGILYLNLSPLDRLAYVGSRGMGAMFSLKNAKQIIE